jgi:hypothetical protein
VYALDPVLALDRPGMVADAYVLRELTVGGRIGVGPSRVQTCLLPQSYLRACQPLLFD